LAPVLLDASVSSYDLNTDLNELPEEAPVARVLDRTIIFNCPLTSKLHPKWRSRLQIKCAKRNAEIAVDQIRTISKQRLKKKIDNLSTTKAAQLRKLITDMYGE
jgi:mRNA interferase MazF